MRVRLLPPAPNNLDGGPPCYQHEGQGKDPLVGSDDANGLRNGIQNADVVRTLYIIMTTYIRIEVGTRRYTTQTQTGTCVGGWQTCQKQ